jgi:hypothetical protein
MNKYTWIEIFKYLDVKSLGISRQVCSEWNKIISDKSIWIFKAYEYNLTNIFTIDFQFEPWFKIIKNLHNKIDVIEMDKYYDYVQNIPEFSSLWFHRVTFGSDHDILIKMNYDQSEYFIYLRYKKLIYDNTDINNKEDTINSSVILVIQPITNIFSWIKNAISIKLSNFARKMLLCNDYVEEWERIIGRVYSYKNILLDGGMILCSNNKADDHLLDFGNFPLANDKIFIKIIKSVEKFYYYYFIMADMYPYTHSYNYLLIKLVQMLDLHVHDSNISLYDNAKKYFKILTKISPY